MKRLIVVLLLAVATTRASAQAPTFEVHEATIAQIHAAMQEKRLTCRAVVEQYLRRIDAFDKNGPAINALILTNPEALRQADDLDRRPGARLRGW